MYYRYYEIFFAWGGAWEYGADERVAMSGRDTPTNGRRMPCPSISPKRMMRFHTAASGG